jgi:1-acyl-sn-glycerol-3-phosphate acyltransferase
MGVWTLLVAALAFLVGPWVLMPERRSEAEVHGMLRLLWGINALYCAFLYRLEGDHLAPLPDRGPAILIANHTCPIDSMLLQATSWRVLGFLIAKEFHDHWVFGPLCRRLRCIPVRRDGQDVAATRAALRALKEGRVVPMFPEGRITPASGRSFAEPRPGVAFLVMNARVPVIPAYVWGTPETNSVWKALLTPARAHVVYGPPIDLSEIAPEADGPVDRAMLAMVSQRLMEAIKALRSQVLEGVREEFDPGRRGPASDGPNGVPRSDRVAGAVSSDRPAVPTA